MAVGNDIFSKDAKEVVALLLSVRRCLLEDNHNLQVTLLQAWEQLLKCLGSHFYPYAKDLMPDLLNYTRLDSNSVTERVIVTKKLKACKLLLRLNKKLKGKFFPWINQVSDIMVPLVKFHDKDIRKIASSAMPKLLLSAKLSIEDEEFHGITNSYLHELVVRFVSSLLEALDEETDGKICATIVKSLTHCIKIDGRCLNETTIQQTANAIEQVLKATSKIHFSKEEVVTDLEKKIIKEVVNYIRILMEIYEESSNALVDKLLACIRMMRQKRRKLPF